MVQTQGSESSVVRCLHPAMPDHVIVIAVAACLLLAAVAQVVVVKQLIAHRAALAVAYLVHGLTGKIGLQHLWRLGLQSSPTR